MNKKYSVIIIGGGFSALVLACRLDARVKKRAAIIEKNARVGKKLLATGNGRGNFTNEYLDLSAYHGGDVSFAEYALKKYDNQVIEGFFAKIGVLSTSENGKVYPLSLQSNSLLDALRLSLGDVALFTETEVVGLKKENGVFVAETNKGEFFADAVAMCVGGAVGKQFGTDGSAFKLVEGFGHRISKLSPSLVQMRTDKASVKGLKGVKEYASVKLFDGDRFVKESRGDLLFTDGGVSGNTVFYLSSYLDGLRSARLVADLAPDRTVEELVESFEARRIAFPKADADILTSGAVHSAVSQKIARTLFAGKKLCELNGSDLIAAACAIKKYRIDITGAGGFDGAQVTRGGVITKDVDGRTFESKLCPSLYLCGEMLDVDGDCGGYNLQWAFSSACCAAEAINEANRDD